MAGYAASIAVSSMMVLAASTTRTCLMKSPAGFQVDCAVDV